MAKPHETFTWNEKELEVQKNNLTLEAAETSGLRLIVEFVVLDIKATCFYCLSSSKHSGTYHLL